MRRTNLKRNSKKEPKKHRLPVLSKSGKLMIGGFAIPAQVVTMIAMIPPSIAYSDFRILALGAGLAGGFTIAIYSADALAGLINHFKKHGHDVKKVVKKGDYYHVEVVKKGNNKVKG